MEDVETIKIKKIIMLCYAIERKETNNICNKIN